MVFCTQGKLSEERKSLDTGCLVCLEGVNNFGIRKTSFTLGIQGLSEYGFSNFSIKNLH